MKQRPSRQRNFGTLDEPWPVIGQGTWGMERDDRQEVIRALRRGVELGLTHIDTAELYGKGEVETILGEALRGLRDRVQLVSKVLPGNASRTGVRNACEQSLRRLGTEYLDCYLLHWEGPHPLADTIDAFEELVEDGLIRSWGVSNFDRRLLDEALRIAGPGRIACNQVLYHLEERTIEHRVLPWCQRHGVALVAYSPFGSGHFPREGSPGRRILDEIARETDASPRQVALAFLTREHGTFAIPKASRVPHVEDNARRQDLVLTDDQVARIDRAFPKGADSGGVPTL